MNSNISDKYYQGGDFRELLQKYEQAKAEGHNVYLEPEELADIAEYYQMLGNVADAVDTFEYGLSIFPDSTMLLILKARYELAILQDVEKAKKTVSQIVEEDDFDCFYVKAEIMIMEGNPEHADEYLEEVAATLDEVETDDFYVDVAAVFADYNLYDLSEKWLQRAKPSVAADYRELQGRIAMHAGNFEESERIFNELIDQDPFSTRYWNHLAASQFMHNNIRESIRSSEFSIAIHPDDSEAILNKANGLFSLGNFAEAKKFYARYAELWPLEETGELFQGLCAFNMNEMKEGIEHLRKAEKLVLPNSENCLEVYQELAFALSKEGKGQEALGYTDKMLETLKKLEGKKRPPKVIDYNETLILRGHLLMEMGEFQKGQDCYTEAIANSNCSPQVYLRIAISIYDLGFFEHSYKMFQILRESTDDSFTDGYAYEALCCYSLNRYNDFCMLVKKACENNLAEAQHALADMFPEDLDPKDYYQWLCEGNRPIIEKQ
ncbi:MAG: tetratricopeptide repeat protein [Prevotella sp.]|nr:tetratricopeptide repeat protein [Prevotella sp.]